MIQLYLLRVVWAGVYGERDTLLGVSSETLLVYLTISSLHRFFLPNIIDYFIQQRVTSGRVAHDLLRPFGFMKQMIAMQIGSATGLLPFLIVIVPAAALVGSLTFPSLENFLCYLVSLALAFVVTLLIWMHVGMLSFWLLNVNGIRAM
ncbi:MAG: ABC-2 family transporter protein, partial [Thermomicrobiales bacterium]